MLLVGFNSAVTWVFPSSYVFGYVSFVGEESDSLVTDCVSTCFPLLSVIALTCSRGLVSVVLGKAPCALSASVLAIRQT